MSTKRPVLAAAAFLLSAGAAAAAPLALPANVNLRWGPGIEYPVQVVVPEGTVIDVERCDELWCEVNWEDFDGFMNREVIGLGEGNNYPPQVFRQVPPPPYVTAFEGYYYDDNLDYAYGPGFGFRYYGGFHGRYNSRAVVHSRAESAARRHSRAVSGISVHNQQTSAAAGHNRSVSRAVTHSRPDSRALRNDRGLLRQRLNRQNDVIRQQKNLPRNPQFYRKNEQPKGPLGPQQNLQQRNLQQQQQQRNLQNQQNLQQRNLQQQQQKIQRAPLQQQRTIQPQQQRQQQNVQPPQQRTAPPPPQRQAPPPPPAAPKQKGLLGQ